MPVAETIHRDQLAVHALLHIREIAIRSLRVMNALDLQRPGCELGTIGLRDRRYGLDSTARNTR